MWRMRVGTAAFAGSSKSDHATHRTTMSMELIVSNSPWNEKTHCTSIECWDPVEVHVRFDQPIVHELEYVDQDVTLFWVEVALNGEIVSRLATNCVLAELQDAMRMFRDGRFRFSLCKLPDALTNHRHARFAARAATLAPGAYPVSLTLFTDNQLQAGKPLAEATFTFEIAPGSAEHLAKIAADNEAEGVDQVDDAAAKAERFAQLWQHKGPSKSAAGSVKVKLAARHADTRVRIHEGPGRSSVITVQKHVETDWHTVTEGSTIDLLDSNDQTVRALVNVTSAHDGTTVVVG
jgi:hypothetical protein